MCGCGNDHAESCEDQQQMQKEEVVAQPTERTSVEASHKIMPLMTVEPSGVNALGNEEWVEIDVAVDSGATETVMSEETLNGVIDITEGPACKRGVKYEVADGVQNPNRGERRFVGVVEDEEARSMTAQICAVNKTLMSVRKIARAGNRVVFDDDDGSYIEDQSTGERLWMEQVGGMCSINCPSP